MSQSIFIGSLLKLTFRITSFLAWWSPSIAFLASIKAADYHVWFVDSQLFILSMASIAAYCLVAHFGSGEDTIAGDFLYPIDWLYCKMLSSVCLHHDWARGTVVHPQLRTAIRVQYCKRCGAVRESFFYVIVPESISPNSGR